MNVVAMNFIAALVLWTFKLPGSDSYSPHCHQCLSNKATKYTLHVSPQRPRDIERDNLFRLIQKISLVVLPTAANAAKMPINDKVYRNPFVNVQADDFWYPPFMLGIWNTTMKFSNALFTTKIPYDKLVASDLVPGLSPYSVIFAPNMGKDVNLLRRYVELDSHPREDHPFNIRELISAFLPESVVDSAPYYFQKAPEWFHSPSNHWTIKYHDQYADGIVELLTRKRNITYFSGTIETIEFFNQKHTRRLYNSSHPPTIRSDDYALKWTISIPASKRNEFVPTEAFRNAQTLVGTLDVLAYLPATSDLYLQVPSEPVVVFTYDITMRRVPGSSSPDKTWYPFVWRDDGPVELDKYFGY